MCSVICHHCREISSAILGVVSGPFHLFWARIFLVIVFFHRGLDRSFSREEYVSGADMAVVTDFVGVHTLSLMTVPKYRLVVEEGFGFVVANAVDEFHTPEKGNDRFSRLDDNFLHLVVHQI
jgi:hypothetical protein